MIKAFFRRKYLPLFVACLVSVVHWKHNYYACPTHAFALFEFEMLAMMTTSRNDYFPAQPGLEWSTFWWLHIYDRDCSRNETVTSDEKGMDKCMGTESFQNIRYQWK